MCGRGLRRLLWLTALICASCLDVRAERLPIKIYTTADGLAHNDVKRIVKDSRGFLWFCTAGGLSRFDGYAFTNFSTEQGLPKSIEVLRVERHSDADALIGDAVKKAALSWEFKPTIKNGKPVAGYVTILFMVN